MKSMSISAAPRDCALLRTETVGVIVNNVSDPFFSTLLASLEDALAKTGRTVFLCNTDESVERQTELIRKMSEYNADGIIVSPAIRSTPEDFRPRGGLMPPLVFVSRTMFELDFDCVVNDDYEATVLPVNHLVGMGHRRIERKYLPDTLNDTQFPTINEVLRLICEFNKILTTGDESENVTPGEFRQGAVVLKHADHKPPPWAEVRNHMTELAENIIRMWNGDPAKLHAYVLWRLNWVHPFFDGNGRTSREFSYFLFLRWTQLGGAQPAASMWTTDASVFCTGSGSRRTTGKCWSTTAMTATSLTLWRNISSLCRRAGFRRHRTRISNLLIYEECSEVGIMNMDPQLPGGNLAH